jgi:hypothetical protein
MRKSLGSSDSVTILALLDLRALLLEKIAENERMRTATATRAARPISGLSNIHPTTQPTAAKTNVRIANVKAVLKCHAAFISSPVSH